MKTQNLVLTNKQRDNQKKARKSKQSQIKELEEKMERQIKELEQKFEEKLQELYKELIITLRSLKDRNLQLESYACDPDGTPLGDIM